MKGNDPRSKRLQGLLKSKPRPRTVEAELVSRTQLSPDLPSPLVIRPVSENIVLHEWLVANQAKAEQDLNASGALLFRGFRTSQVEDFQRFVSAFNVSAVEYIPAASPRSKVDRDVYTSTDHPPEHEIQLHNELSHALNWPMKIIFFCLLPAETGGETPLADCRAIFQALKPATIELFRQKGIRYVRNIREGFGLSWQDVFRTEDRAIAESFCAENDIELIWKTEQACTISWVRPAIHTHPATGEELWFNHSYFFNAGSLSDEVRDYIGDAENLPFQTSFGDGSPIGPDVVAELSEAYAAATFKFPYEQGDILLVDNMRLAHGRSSFTGPRRILVSMCEPRFSANR